MHVNVGMSARVVSRIFILNRRFVTYFFQTCALHMINIESIKERFENLRFVPVTILQKKNKRI